MKLKVLLSARYKITAISSDSYCETETFFNELPDKYHSSLVGMLRLIEHIADHGLEGLPVKQCHLIDRQNKIYELIKGDLRLLFFKGHCDILIIASHGFLKKSQKTPENHKDKAIRHKKQYQQAHDAKCVDLIEDQED